MCPIGSRDNKWRVNKKCPYLQPITKAALSVGAFKDIGIRCGYDNCTDPNNYCNADKCPMIKDLTKAIKMGIVTVDTKSKCVTFNKI